MTNDNSNDTDENEDNAELSTGRDVTLSVGGETIECSGLEWELEDDTHDALALALQGTATDRKLNGTITWGSGGFPAAPEMVADVTISESEGDNYKIEKGTIKYREQVREEAQEIRANAPPESDLSDRTAAIDDVITALLRAKDRGVDEVYVNDDGMTRTPDPRITNNHVHYYGSGPKPGELEEWVEL